MHILEKYAKGFQTQDPKQISECFTEDAIFDDGGVEPLRGPGVRMVLHGRAEIEQGLGAVKTMGSDAKIIARYGNAMIYDIILGEHVLPCIGMIVEEKDGLIQHYIIRTRKED